MTDAELTEHKMSNKRVNKSRRALLNTTLGLGALGAALPSRWTKPIVSAVVLPVHAQTSPIPSFSVEKTQSGGPNPAMLEGDVIEYTIVVSNTGNVDLTNVVATDTLPDGSVETLSGQVESSNADGVLEIGENWTYTTSYTVTVADLLDGTALTNTVSVEVAQLPDMPEVDTAVTPLEAVECPEIAVGNVIRGPGSGPTACSLSFDIFSATTTTLTVTEIVNTTLSADSVVVYGSFPVNVIDSVGTRVSWTGQLTTPECAGASPDFSFDISSVVFSVTATCEGAVESITMDFSLADIAAMA